MGRQSSNRQPAFSSKRKQPPRFTATPVVQPQAANSQQSQLPQRRPSQNRVDPLARLQQTAALQAQRDHGQQEQSSEAAASSWVQTQRVDGSTEAVLLANGQFLSTGSDTIQCDFVDEAIATLNLTPERLENSECSSSSEFIYKALSNGNSAGNGKGEETLLAAISDAEGRPNDVFIFKVDIDILGHYFTILQQGNQAAIIQGYVDTLSIAENISSTGGARERRNTGVLKQQLNRICKLRTKICNERLWGGSEVDELYMIHEQLFGIELDLKKKRMIQSNMMDPERESLNWCASFVTGEGAMLDGGSEQDGKKKKKGGCFLTTACTQYRGLPDDCEELTVLRAFRDNYMQGLAAGPELILGYYEIAPAIVTTIQAKPEVEADSIWAMVYQTIRLCVDAIHQGDNQTAFETYQSQVLALQQQLIEGKE